MAIHIYSNVPDLVKAMADFIVSLAQKSIASQGEFNIVLSGGNSPKKLYETLASSDYNTRLEWSKVNFFFGDERYVPAHDPENNCNMVRKALFTPLQISESKIFSIDTSLPVIDAAADYAKRINKHFKDQAARFDLVLLGLGDNAHTASLFPFTDVINEKAATIKSVFLKQQNTYRITMTAPLINQARNVAFMVFGLFQGRGCL